MKHEAAAMLKNGGGAIVNTSSIAGHVGFAGGGVYVASKHAILGLSKSAALDFARKGIRVNTVSPGTIQTEMIDRMVGPGETETRKLWEDQHPIGRFGAADEVAAVVVWLSSPEASFITGTDIAVDGGYLAR
jgi:NAD(P)-dependent dehydrogenase (short-subunit alcohol dehydrogenase family)